jgi:ABC-type multidrug transport system fused ATPase/permease subunit
MEQQQISTEDKLKGLRVIWYFIRPYKRRLILLVSLALLAGFLETLQVAVLYPILTASLDMESLRLANNPFFVILNKIAELIPVDSLLISYVILFIILIIAVFLLRLLYINLSAKTVAKVSIEYKHEVFQKYTESDYQFFVDNRQGDLLYKARGAPEFYIYTGSALQYILEGHTWCNILRPNLLLLNQDTGSKGVLCCRAKNEGGQPG